MPAGVRLSELLASLSLATDLGLGLPQEHVLRQTLLADRIAELHGLSDRDRACVLHVSLMAWVGCVADSHELAHWFGDDLALRAESYSVDKAGLPMLRFMVDHLVDRGGSWGRIGVVGRFLSSGVRQTAGGFVAHCQTTGDIADRLGLDDRVRRALGQAFERWDGKGVPRRLAGDEIELVMRIVQVADDAEVFHRHAGPAAAVAMLRDRRGTEFDPALVDLLDERLEDVFSVVDVTDPWAAVVDRCAAVDRRIPDAELTEMLAVCADYADLKSPWWTGHSRAVADLAAEAAKVLGVEEPTITVVRRAGLVHRLGAVGVSTGIWDKPEPLSDAERERVRNVPYLTARILARQPVLASVGAVAVKVHERLDGSGYPHGLTAEAIPAEARLLGAARRYQALCAARPHRPAMSPAQRADALESEAAAGRLDGAAVDAVLSAAGHRAPRRRVQVAGLTPREIEVLALVARGRSNREIAAALGISARTVSTHVEHVYTKAGVSTRGAAAMFAMRHRLVDPGVDG
jgi:HD-GYP domain-containing protein (c-di-GMP phosphodiesterase class II)